MTAIYFPPTPAEDATVEHEGVVYTWNGSYWEANVANSELDGRYVSKDGDNMVGNLTLSTDQVVLDASDGSGAFAGKVTALATEDSDGDTTVVTKGYLDDVVAGIDIELSGVDLWEKDGRCLTGKP